MEEKNIKVNPLNKEIINAFYKLDNLDKTALIEELKQIRKRISIIYQELGNPNKCRADYVLADEIKKFEK